MTREVTEENRRRLAEWEAEHQINEEVKQVLEEASAATSTNILSPALLTMKYTDKILLGLQALVVIELRRIVVALKE